MDKLSMTGSCVLPPPPPPLLLLLLLRVLLSGEDLSAAGHHCLEHRVLRNAPGETWVLGVLQLQALQ
jgi:hypothetical protein